MRLMLRAGTTPAHSPAIAVSVYLLLIAVAASTGAAVGAGRMGPVYRSIGGM